MKKFELAPLDNIEPIIRATIKLPGVRINRERFLRKELSKHFPQNVVREAIRTNPAQAGISVKQLEHIAKACINNETIKVTAISAAAGVPGGVALVATIPTDAAQFISHVLRVMQKLIYLYGWDEVSNFDDDSLDDGAANVLILFMGVMFGVAGAALAVAKIAGAAAAQVEKALLRKALAKGVIYPIVKKVAKLVGINMTKGIFAKSVGKAVPIIGGVVSGGLTLASFKPMASKLKNYLCELPLADVEFYKHGHGYAKGSVTDIDFSDVVIDDIPTTS